jgi:peptide/nickel transport system permease protein
MEEATIDAQLGPLEMPSRLGEAWGMFLRNRAAVVGLCLWVIILLAAILGPAVYITDPFDLAGPPMIPPCREFPLGTDYLGCDVLAGIIHGAWVTLLVGVTATAFTVIIGLIIGVLSGYYGGWVDNILMRVTEFFQVLPALLLAMLLVTLFSPSIMTIILAIGVVSWTAVARLTRAEFIKIKEREYVLAERAIGASSRRIIWRVILPNALPPLIVATALGVGVSILFEAALSFLGLGDPNTYTWGYMIGASRDYIWETWWAVTFPGLAIFLTVLSISLIGDGLNDALNPKLRLR